MFPSILFFFFFYDIDVGIIYINVCNWRMRVLLTVTNDYWHTHLKSLFIIPKYYTLKSHHYKVILIFNNDNVKNCKYKLSKSTISIYNTKFWHTSTEVCIKLLTRLKYFQKKNVYMYIWFLVSKRSEIITTI